MRILDAFGVEIVDYYLKNDLTKRNHSIDFIVVHYTAGTSSSDAKNTVSSWNNDPNQASANYVVDRKKIVHTVADDEAVYTWHCGTSGKYYHPTCRNSNSIGIEMQSDYDGKFPGYKNLKYPTDWDRWYLRDEVVENATKLVAYLMKKYHLSDVDTQVLRHYDVTHKECPYPMVGKNENKWVEFKQRVKKYLNGEVESMTKEELKKFIEETVRNMGVGEPADAWASEQVEVAKGLGITDGSNPKRYATREEVMIMAKRAAEINKV